MQLNNYYLCERVPVGLEELLWKSAALGDKKQSSVIFRKHNETRIQSKHAAALENKSFLLDNKH